MIHSQPRALAYAVLAVTVVLLAYGMIYARTATMGILLLAVPVAAFAAICGWKAAKTRMI